MSASDALGGQWAKMRPSELHPYVEQYRVGDEGGRKLVAQYGESIRRRGYRSSLHDAFHPSQSTHIWLGINADGERMLMNGNHRVQAMVEVGYDKPVKVRVTDLRRR